MSRGIHRLAGVAFSVAVATGSAVASPSCTAVADKLDGVFSDIHNKISDESRAQISLLRDCVTQHSLCVIVEAPAPKWIDVVKGNSMKDISKKVIGDRHAISSLTFVPTRTGQGRCALSRFGGGTASVWTIDAWEIAGNKTRTLSTDRVELRGEFKSPEELVRESEKLVRALK